MFESREMDVFPIAQRVNVMWNPSEIWKSHKHIYASGCPLCALLTQLVLLWTDKHCDLLKYANLISTDASIWFEADTEKLQFYFRENAHVLKYEGLSPLCFVVQLISGLTSVCKRPWTK